jgi:hypothetical protein
MSWFASANKARMVAYCDLRGAQGLSLRSPFSPAQPWAILFTHPSTDCLAIVYPGRALFPGGDGETLLWLSPLGDVADVMKDLTWEQS